MDRRLEKIRSAVANLAASPDEQIAYLRGIGDSVGPDRLALEFDDISHFGHALARDGVISPTQHRMLQELGRKLIAFSGQENASHQRLEALHEAGPWIEVRALAARFLNSFDGALPPSLPPFRLVAEPMTEEAREASGFRWAKPPVGHRHRLGGAPDFLQAPEWPDCPGCRAKMTFYAQLDSIGDGICLADCGMIYVFVCFDCYEAASIFQT
jgi:hypothetical protein